jgi:(+)-pinoresinol hydroxylase
MTPAIYAIAAGLALSGIAQAAAPNASAGPAPVQPTGAAVYDHWCAPCHAAGPGHPGTESLQLKYAGQRPAVLLERTDLSAQTVATYVRQGVLLMAPFRKTEISDPELQRLAAYVAGNLGKAP